MIVIQHTIKEALEESTDSFIYDMAKEMHVKFDKYYSKYSLILAIAVVFDPRYKLQFVEYCYKQLYGANSREMKAVRDKLTRLFDIYMCTFSKPSESSTSENVDGFQRRQVDVRDDSQGDKLSDKFMKGFDSFECDDTVIIEKNQLDLYLLEPKNRRTDDIDILAYWRANQFRFPELSMLARDILSIPLSTVASESAFSEGGRVIDQYRSALKSECVEALICTRDWLFDKNENLKPSLDDLCENIMSKMVLDNSDDRETLSGQSSNAAPTSTINS